MQTPHSTERVEVGMDSLVELAVEHWRMMRSLAVMAGGGPAPMRHAVRKLGDFLARLEIEAIVLDGQPYDAGMAARVIDVVEDPLAPAGSITILETLSPQVLVRGRVVRPAEVVTRRRAAGA